MHSFRVIAIWQFWFRKYMATQTFYENETIECSYRQLIFLYAILIFLKKENVNQLTKVGVHNSSTDFSSLSKTYNDNARAAAANLEGSWKFKRIVKNYVKLNQINFFSKTYPMSHFVIDQSQFHDILGKGVSKGIYIASFGISA